MRPADRNQKQRVLAFQQHCYHEKSTSGGSSMYPSQACPCDEVGGLYTTQGKFVGDAPDLLDGPADQILMVGVFGPSWSTKPSGEREPPAAMPRGWIRSRLSLSSFIGKSSCQDPSRRTGQMPVPPWPSVAGEKLWDSPPMIRPTIAQHGTPVASLERSDS